MKSWARNKQGFTIVELLIVIVVIAILAAITVVAFNGIRQRATASSLSNSLNQIGKKVTTWQVENSGASPASLADVGVSDANGVAYQYSQTDGGTGYCVTATSQGTTYTISSASGRPQPGVCSGYNLLVWNKPSTASMPVPSATYDASTFRTSTGSMRLNPNSPGLSILGSPYTGTVGEVFTVSFWMKSDSGWNGLGNNSKVRFGSASGGGPLTVCSYNGVKLSWTYITCSHTVAPTDLTLTISVGNDGTVGNIWIDDFTFSRA